jgi:hypothetical protein
MDVAMRSELRELDPQLWVTGSKDAYPADHGFAPRDSTCINHHADAFVYDSSNSEGHLIDFTFCNAAMSTGLNGAVPGGHADRADDAKEEQYSAEFPGLRPDSSPAFVSLSMERHGSWSQGTRTYWKARWEIAHQRQVTTMEFPTPLSVITRRVLQTLAIALWRVNASHILQLHRRALHGSQRVAAGVENPAGGAGAGP